MKLVMAAVCALMAVSAEAATFQFTYLADIGTVTGRLTGTLQGDNNTVLVSGVKDFVKVGGVALPHFNYVLTGSTIYGEPTPPTVTFDGSVLDFVACTDNAFCDGSEGFGFDSPGIIAFEPIFTLYAAAFDFAQIQESLVPGNWTLTAVPEPAAWALMVAGFALVGTAARRRTRAVAA